jgi:hypothetical protein
MLAREKFDGSHLLSQGCEVSRAFVIVAALL